jgi:hypothetical protein
MRPPCPEWVHNMMKVAKSASTRKRVDYICNVIDYQGNQKKFSFFTFYDVGYLKVVNEHAHLGVLVDDMARAEIVSGQLCHGVAGVSCGERAVRCVGTLQISGAEFLEDASKILKLEHISATFVCNSALCIARAQGRSDNHSKAMAGHFKTMYHCRECGRCAKHMKGCSRCKLARYCDTKCQVAHWKHHKPRCVPVEQE